MHQILTPSPMPSLPLDAAIQLMQKRFEKDAIITLATIYEGRPYAREADAWYHDGSFYLSPAKIPERSSILPPIPRWQWLLYGLMVWAPL